MTERLQPRPQGRALIVAVAISLLVVLVVAVPIVAAFAQQADRVADAQRDLTGYRAKIAGRSQLEAELALVRSEQSAADTLLSGSSTALAAANMQGLVKTLVERHGGQMRSAQNLASADSAGLEKITVQYELSVPLASLKAVTYELETATPFLMIDAADVHPETYGNAGAPANLHVQWTVHGYRRVDAQ